MTVPSALSLPACRFLLNTEGRWPYFTLNQATIFAIIVAGWMASLPAATGKPAGTGGLILWPLFGATNQLLGGLAFMVIIFWMRRQLMPVWFVIIPAIFMLILPAWAMGYQIFGQAIGSDLSWIGQERWLLVGIGSVSLLLEIWMVAEAIVAWRRMPSGMR